MVDFIEIKEINEREEILAPLRQFCQINYRYPVQEGRKCAIRERNLILSNAFARRSLPHLATNLEAKKHGKWPFLAYAQELLCEMSAP